MTTNRNGLSGIVARGRKRLSAIAWSSPWLITPRAALFDAVDPHVELHVPAGACAGEHYALKLH